jgi:hypothetical protein
MRNTMNTMKKRKPSNRANVLPLTPRRREAMDLLKFIDAHGGRLGAFRPPTRPGRRHHRPPQTRARSETISSSSRAHAARCTARHGVGSCAVPAASMRSCRHGGGEHREKR